MIRFYFHPTPNPAKVALFLEESGLTYELVPVDTSKGEQHQPSFRAVNPNGKVPAIVDTEGPGGKEARVFDSSAILLYLAEKTARFLGTGLGPFSGQAVHFQFAAPDGRDYIVGSDYTIVDMSAWCWIDRASRVMKGEDDRLAPLPSVKRWFTAIDGRLAVARARGRKGSRVQEGERRENEACALPVEPHRDRQLGGSRVSSRRDCGNGNDNSTAFPNALHET